MTLSERETQVLRAIAVGKPSRNTAMDLGIDVKTVLTYRFRLMHKIGATNTTELVHYALARGLVKNLYANEPTG